MRQVIRFSGLVDQEMQQLSAPARRFAISAADSRRLAPVRLRTARFVRAIAPALTAAQIPGPFYIAFPIELVLTAIGSIIAKSVNATAVSAIEAARPRKLVVWLRRFHQIGYDRFPLRDLFEELSSWGLLAYTLSDDAVYRSTLAERVIRRWVRQRVMQLPDGARLLKIRNIIGGVLFFVSLLGMAPVLIATRDYSGWIQLFSVLCFIGSMVLTYEIAIRLLLRHFYRSKKFREVYKPLFVEAMIELFSISAVKAPCSGEPHRAHLAELGIVCHDPFVDRSDHRLHRLKLRRQHINRQARIFLVRNDLQQFLDPFAPLRSQPARH